MSPVSSRFGELRPAQKLSPLTLLVAILCVTACSAMSANDFSSASSSKSMQVRLVQALKQEGKYSAAATFLGAVDLNQVLPESSTILVPMDEGVAESGLQFSNFNTAMPILQYHVIVRRLVFHDLQQLPVGRTLQTLLPNNTVIITSNSSANFSIDDVLMSHKNLFIASSIVVHGMNGVLNSALYGRMTHFPDFQPSAPPAVSPYVGDIGGASPAHQPSAPRADIGDIGGASPAHQPGPPFAGNSSNNTASPAHQPVPAFSGNSSNNGTNSSTNVSFSPPSTPAVQAAGNASSPSFSLPVPSPPSQPHQTEVPASPAQQVASPVLQPSCVGADVGVCGSASSSDHQVTFYRFSFPALLLSGICFIAGLYEMPRLPLFCMILATMAATPAKGENKDVAEVLRSRGGFDYAATYLEAMDMHRVLPNRSTVLVPTDAALEATGLIYNTLGAALPILQYHVITRELLFKDLQILPVGEMLETMLPKASVLVTSNVPWNFTLNDVLLSHPDILCVNGSAMHGIAGVMNYSHVSGIPPPETPDQLPVLAPPTTPGQLPVLAPPIPPQLTLPLPESAAPFAVPFPVSHANLLVRKMIDSRSTFITGLILLCCIGSF